MTAELQIRELRDVIRKLDATGDDGFEGLMAVVLTEVAKTSFALAKSGAQHGRDGQSALDLGAIAFEGKRYDETVPKNEVLSKIAEIAANDRGGTDLWILGATAPVRMQDIETINSLGARLGVSTLILDWPTTGLPPLAALLAMASIQATTFLSPRAGVSEWDITAKLDAIRKHDQFAERVQELSAAIQQPSIGPAFAHKKNAEFLTAAFANRKKAKAIFGQPLAPGDASVSGVLDRAILRAGLANLAFGKPSGCITAILGGDGNGKSWLFGQSWLHQPIKPLTIILVPDDIKEPVTLANVEELLITGLINQTGDSELEVTRLRWRKHFSIWKRNPAPNVPRLVVFMDGLNQRPNVQWVRALNALSQILEGLGGNLVLSCRTPFFRNSLDGKLVDPLKSIEVPPWTDPELESLLTERGTSIGQLRPQVVESLRNPRIFAVAEDLFRNRKIEGFVELSVSRLLFEHIRAGASPTAELLSFAEFVRGVRDHADEIIKRINEARQTDLKIFSRLRLSDESTSFRDQLALISAGSFFQEVPGEPTLYRLKDDSLPLALGLSLLSTARQAERNKLSIPGELSKLLDPIAALDSTAEVLISALIAAVLGEETSPEVVSALATAFVALQNLDAAKFPEFRALVRQDVVPFLQALESATLGDDVTANLSWLTTALLDCRDVPGCHPKIMSFADRWLSMYSLSPKRMMFGRHPSDSDEWANEYRKRKERLDEKLAAMSPIESDFLSLLTHEERGDYTKLNRIAFQFVAARPLAALGRALCNWCFAASLNGGFDDGHDEFSHLVQFNRVDWQLTRIAILKAAEEFRSPEISATGRWALVYALRATADPTDAKQATEIWEDLIKDRERYPGGRLVEKWCAVDPCDPSTLRPDNIEQTAIKYASLDVNTLKNLQIKDRQDHFFEGALVGLARFEPDTAIRTLRRFAEDVVKRDRTDFRIAAFDLHRHTSILDDSIASKFVAKANDLATDALTIGDENQELFVASQYSLMIAFPHLTGDEQVQTLMAYPKVDNILLGLCDSMRSADPKKFEAELERAYDENNAVNLFRLMAFGQSTDTILTDRAKAIVSKLVVSTRELVRLCALAVVRRVDDPELLKAVVDSGWSAQALDSRSARFESWYGSEVLVLAAERGLISVDDCVARIAVNAYYSLIRRDRKDAVPAVASRIDAALRKAAGYTISASLPDIEQPMEDGKRPMLYNVEERTSSDESLRSALSPAVDANNAWYERQRRIRETVERLEEELTTAGAELIIRTVTTELVAEIYKETPKVVRSWFKYVMMLDERQLSQVHNFALPVGEVIATEDQTGAVALFEKLMSTDPLMRVTVGKAHVSLDSVALWKAGDGDMIRELRFRRLDQARSDQELANEVLAALDAGKIDTVRDYALDRHSRIEPSYVARAIMVSGLCYDVPWALGIIDAHKNDHGFLFDCYKAASYAMERHKWSEHWAEQMSYATTEKDLWRYGILLSKVADGRARGYDYVDASRSLLKRYEVSFNGAIRRRIDRWKDKRSRTLFGGKLPDPMFLA